MSSTIVYRQPGLYDGASALPIRDAKRALDKYVHLLRWKEGETILDVGSGSGNVTTQILAPRLPADYKLLAGLDLSPYNVKYAAEKYSDPRTTFLQGDIIEPDFHTLEECFEKQDITIGFDKIFSFHCLDWTNNSVKWSKNIYSLLNPGGQTFLMFFTKSAFIELWIEVAFSDRWIQYTKAVGPYRSEFHDSADIDDDLTKMMTKAGFVVESCEHYSCYYEKDWTDETMLNLHRSVNVYAHTIPEELLEEYFEDLYNVYKKYKEDYKETGIPYLVSVIVASKPEN